MTLKMQLACEWPGCHCEALCGSGNFGNRLVCAEHFKVTNGTATLGWDAIGPLLDAMMREASGQSALATPTDADETVLLILAVKWMELQGQPELARAVRLVANRYSSLAASPAHE